MIWLCDACAPEVDEEKLLGRLGGGPCNGCGRVCTNEELHPRSVHQLIDEIRRLRDAAKYPARPLIIKLPEDRGCGHLDALEQLQAEVDHLRALLDTATRMEPELPMFYAAARLAEAVFEWYAQGPDDTLENWIRVHLKRYRAYRKAKTP